MRKFTLRVWVGLDNDCTTQGKAYKCYRDNKSIRGYQFKNNYGGKDWGSATCFIELDRFKKIRKLLRALGENIPLICK